MRHDLSSSFNKPEFQELLAKYEEMKQNHTHVYLETNELTQLAEYYAYQGNIRLSEEVIDYGLKLHPENMDILIYKCNNLVAQGKTDEALFLLDSIPDQNDREVRLTYANICIERKDIEEAERTFRQIAEEENDITTFLDIADIYMDTNLGKQAYRWLQKAYSQAPDDIEVLESMADYYYSFQSMEQAIVFYNKLLDENPYNIDYWIELTRCYLQTGEVELGMEAVEFALAIDDQNLTCIEMKGYCFQLLGDSESACECYHRVENVLTCKSRIQQVLLNCYFLDKKYQEALVYCNKLLKGGELEEFEKAAIYHKQAVCHLCEEQYQKCKEDIRKGFACDKEYADLYVIQGELFVTEDKMTEAESSFERAKAFSMEKTETILDIAFAYMRYEHFEQALDILLQMEKDYPEEIKLCYCYMACCYHRLKDEKQMFKYIVRSCVYHPAVLTNPKLIEYNTKEEDRQFLILSREIMEQIKNGDLDPAPYL